MFAVGEKVEVLNLIRKEKKLPALLAEIYGKNEPSIPEVVKKEKEIHARFAVAPHTTKVMAMRVLRACLGGKGIAFVGGRQEQYVSREPHVFLRKH